MSAPNEPFGLPDGAPELARRFAWIMAGLGALVARRFLKMPHLTQFTVLLCSYLHRAVRRFYRALTRKPGEARVVRARGERRADTRARPVALPRGRGWIVRELGWEAAAFMSQLTALLSEVDARGAVAGSPGAVQVLRPICRMLGVVDSVVPQAVTPVVAAVGVVVDDAPASDGVVGDCAVIETS